MVIAEKFGVRLVEQSYYWGMIPMTIIGAMANVMIVCVWYRQQYHPIRFLLKALAISHTLFALCYHGYVTQDNKDYFGYVTRLARLFSVHGSLLLTVVQYFRAFHSHASPFFSRPRIAGGLVVVFLWCLVVRNVPLMLHYRLHVEDTLIETFFLCISVELPALVQLAVALALVCRVRRQPRLSQVNINLPSKKFSRTTVGQSTEWRGHLTHSRSRLSQDVHSGVTVTTALSPTNLIDSTPTRKRSNLTVQEPQAPIASRDLLGPSKNRQDYRNRGPALPPRSTAPPALLRQTPPASAGEPPPRATLAPPRPIRGNATQSGSNPHLLETSSQSNRQLSLAGSGRDRLSPFQRNLDTVSVCSRFSQKSWGKISMSKLHMAAHMQVRVDDNNLRRAVVLFSVLPAILYSGGVVGASYYLITFDKDAHVRSKDLVYSYYSLATLFNFGCHLFFLLALCPDFRQSLILFFRAFSRCRDARIVNAVLSRYRRKRQVALKVPQLEHCDENRVGGDGEINKVFSGDTMVSVQGESRSGTYWTTSEMSLPGSAEESGSHSESSGSHSSPSGSSDDSSSRSASLAGVSTTTSITSRLKPIRNSLSISTSSKSRRKRISLSSNRTSRSPSKKSSTDTTQGGVFNSKAVVPEPRKGKTEVLPGAVPSDT